METINNLKSEPLTLKVIQDAIEHLKTQGVPPVPEIHYVFPLQWTVAAGVVAKEFDVTPIFVLRIAVHGAYYEKTIKILERFCEEVQIAKRLT